MRTDEAAFRDVSLEMLRPNAVGLMVDQIRSEHVLSDTYKGWFRRALQQGYPLTLDRYAWMHGRAEGPQSGSFL